MKALKLTPIAMLLALSLSGCSQLVGDLGAKRATVSITASFEDRDLAPGARTIAPEAPSPSGYRLYGSSTGEDPLPLLATFASPSGTALQLAQSSAWTMRLDAVDSSSNVIATRTKTGISLGSTSVSIAFALAPVAAGSGSVDVSVSWPAEAGVASVETRITGPLPGLTALTIDPALDIVAAGDTLSMRVTLARSGMASGEYLAAFFLKDGNGKVLSSLTELVRVAPFLTSKAELVLKAAEFNTPPQAPTGLTAAYASASSAMGSVSLGWSDNSSNETGFSIERSLDGGTDWSPLATSVAGSRSYTDAQATRGSTFLYRIKATNGFGDSAWNSTAAGTEIPCLLVFDSQGGPAVDYREMAAGSTLSIPAPPARTGYRFLGWNSSSAGTGADYAPGDTYTAASSSVTLYAKWMNFVVFDKNCRLAGGTMADMDIPSGAGVSLPANAFTKRGWNFCGWSRSPSDTAEFTDRAQVSEASGLVRLYAVWLHSSDTYSVGDVGPNDGWYFYDDGMYRYEAAPSDATTSTWGLSGVEWPPDDFSSIGKGRSNSEMLRQTAWNLAAAIFSDPGRAREMAPAAFAVRDYGLGYSGDYGWFIPSKGELIKMWENLGPIQSVHLSGSYWSSTPSGGNAAWICSGLANGTAIPAEADRGSIYKIRAIHQF